MAKVTGQGSVVQLERDKPRGKCRKWQLRVPVGRDARTGKYRQRTRVAHGTYTEARKALRAFIEEVEGDHTQGRSDFTFESYCRHYLDLREAKREVGPATLRRQRGQFRACAAHIGKVRLEQVTPAMLNEMYAAMLRGDTLSGRPSSGTYVNQIHKNVSLAYEAAKAEGVVSENPCDRVTPPKVDTRAKKAIPPDKARAFIESLDPTDPHQCAWLIAATTGLRRGEICALSWGDVDWERHLLNVRHSLDNLGNLKATKTKAGTRVLPLPQITLRALEAAREAQRAQFDKTNGFRKPGEGLLVQDESTPVIVGRCGERMRPNSMSRCWADEREAFGLGDYTLHELRHTYLTLLAEEGVHPKVMQELAGHSSSQITMDIYTHVNMDAKREAVAAVSRLF